MKYRSMLEQLRVWLNPRYSHTRCPVCIHIVDVDGNGNMVSHGSGFEPCVASERNDEEVADELDRAVAQDRQRAGRDEARLRAEK